jgi:hypothetical protein
MTNPIAVVFAAFTVDQYYAEEGSKMIGLYSTQEKANTAAREQMEKEMVEAGEGATVAFQGERDGFQSWEMVKDDVVRHDAYAVAIPVQ